ncbi:hypothetical protein BASA81_008807 [Batrachochytrium salamandrivorans]|nr:hypothetical protein BASA81_008807 [Batrachochytrium salamandrivorans]
MAGSKQSKRRVRSVAGLVALVATVLAGGALEWLERKVPSPSSSNNTKTNTETETEVVSREERVVIQRPPSVPSSHLLLPSSSEIISTHNGAFVTSYSTRLRNPNWSCVRLARGGKEEEEASRSKSRFKEDPAIPAPFRTKPDEFLRSGLDRGHSHAAADVSSSQAAMDQSFLMSNISPQVGVGLNRHFWQLLEAFCRSLTFSFSDVLVCTGPLFLPEYCSATQTWQVRYQVIGPKHDIAVPTHFFKCIHASNNSDNSASQACFVVPNRAIDLKQEPLAGFAVSKEEVERLAGFQMFQPTPHSPLPKPLCDEVKCQLAKDSFLK